jgi:hypothetical protein
VKHLEYSIVPAGRLRLSSTKEFAQAGGGGLQRRAGFALAIAVRRRDHLHRRGNLSCPARIG